MKNMEEKKQDLRSVLPPEANRPPRDKQRLVISIIGWIIDLIIHAIRRRKKETAR